MRQTLSMLAGIFLSTQCFAQYSISGIIYDETGQPLAGANIHIENTFTGTVSDSKGYYFLEKLSAGKKKIHVSYIGYDTAIKMADVSQDLKMDFVLMHSVHMGDEVIITGVRAGEKDPVAFSLMKKEEIRERNFGAGYALSSVSFPIHCYNLRCREWYGLYRFED
jgi:iron complex outermembrane recepter protein